MKIGALVLVSTILLMGAAVFAAEPGAGEGLKINDGGSVANADEAVRYVPPTVFVDASDDERWQPETGRPEPATDTRTDTGKAE
jgi:hypothetical protein